MWPLPTPPGPYRPQVLTSGGATLLTSFAVCGLAFAPCPGKFLNRGLFLNQQPTQKSEAPGLDFWKIESFMSLGRKLPVGKDGREGKPLWSKQAPFAGGNAEGGVAPRIIKDRPEHLAALLAPGLEPGFLC